MTASSFLSSVQREQEETPLHLRRKTKIITSIVWVPLQQAGRQGLGKGLGRSTSGFDHGALREGGGGSCDCDIWGERLCGGTVELEEVEFMGQ